MKALEFFIALPLGSQVAIAVQVILMVTIVVAILVRPFKEDLR